MNKVSALRDRYFSGETSSKARKQKFNYGQVVMSA